MHETVTLLTSPPHLKNVVTLPCNLSLMACFADVNVSQGYVAIYARFSGIFDTRLTVNLPRNLQVKSFLNHLRIHRIMVMSLWPRFLAHPVCLYPRVVSESNYLNHTVIIIMNVSNANIKCRRYSFLISCTQLAISHVSLS